MKLPEDEWKKKLSPECYYICRSKGTEPPFKNKYCDCHEKGVYYCAACGAPLFSSDDKYDSGSGWPSFKKPIASNRVVEKTDSSQEMIRTEVLCASCDSHLGHVFPDGPKPLGLRYCINSGALDLKSF